jgi:hypothetical protein
MGKCWSPPRKKRGNCHGWPWISQSFALMDEKLTLKNGVRLKYLQVKKIGLKKGERPPLGTTKKYLRRIPQNHRKI